jgi:hypothetical protein
MSSTASPSRAAILERARSLANEAVWAVALQHRRLRTQEPEDDHFVFRYVTDLQFLIVALRRLRRAAELAARAPDVSADLGAAVNAFDSALPALAVMRNVGEHIDEYAVDHPKRRHRKVDRRQLQVSVWNGSTYQWLGHELDIDAALTAAENLYHAIKSAAQPRR